MSTPHIAAAPGDFAESVLMPGDPLRARWIAENHLDDAREVTSIRGMLGYTGTYRSQPVSVMGSGMGIPSMCIYATELYQHYGVRNIVRVGSCGAIRSDVALREVIVATGAGTDSNVNRQRIGGFDLPTVADAGLVRAAVDGAERQGIAVRVGTLFSSDQFYGDDSIYPTLAAHGILGVEMEAAGLYGVAAACGGAALAICTVSDHILDDTHLSAEDRQSSFVEMISVALEAVAPSA